MDSSKAASADQPADEQADDTAKPASHAPTPVDTEAQEQAGQDRADGGGYT